MAEGNGKALVLSDVHVPTPAVQRGITGEAWNALRNSIYKGASDAMILLAVDYCKARKHDPLMKPVHIVKTWDAEKKTYVEGIWPGIHLHRTTAARTKEYAGQDDPEFGQTVTKQLGERQVTFPEWCKIRVYRMIQGQRVAYTGMVFFEEAFAKGKDGGPNAMWSKRPRGQLAKCAEAEALRKAFPEETTGEPTAEEMEGAHVGPDNAKDVTPAAEQSRKLDALEELIGAAPQQTEEPPATVEAAALNEAEDALQEAEIVSASGSEALNRYFDSLPQTIKDGMKAISETRLKTAIRNAKQADQAAA